jgi:hypothetical protein
MAGSKAQLSIIGRSIFGRGQVHMPRTSFCRKSYATGCTVFCCIWTCPLRVPQSRKEDPWAVATGGSGCGQTITALPRPSVEPQCYGLNKSCQAAVDLRKHLFAQVRDGNNFFKTRVIGRSWLTIRSAMPGWRIIPRLHERSAGIWGRCPYPGQAATVYAPVDQCSRTARGRPPLGP